MTYLGVVQTELYTYKQIVLWQNELVYYMQVVVSIKYLAGS